MLTLLTLLTSLTLLFQGIKELELSGEPKTTVQKLLSNEGEEVALGAPLELTGKVEHYLGGLIGAIRDDLLAKMKQACYLVITPMASPRQDEAGMLPSYHPYGISSPR